MLLPSGVFITVLFVLLQFFRSSSHTWGSPALESCHLCVSCLSRATGLLHKPASWFEVISGPQHLSRVDVWTLARPIPHLDLTSFVIQVNLAGVFWMIALLHEISTLVSFIRRLFIIWGYLFVWTSWCELHSSNLVPDEKTQKRPETRKYSWWHKACYGQVWEHWVCTTQWGRVLKLRKCWDCENHVTEISCV